MSDEAIQERIKAHMNANHTRELSHYLRHRASLPPRAATRPWIKTLDLSSMTIAAGGLGGRELAVPFDPPLSSYADARPRLVAMADESRAALGLSDVHVSVYAPPRGFDVVVFAGVAFYFFCYATLSAVLPGAPIWSALVALFPGGPLTYRWLVGAIFWPVLGLHIAEAYWMHRSRLIKHDVYVGSGVWWSWVGSTFFEGVCAFRRFDAIVRENKREKEAKSH